VNAELRDCGNAECVIAELRDFWKCEMSNSAQSRNCAIAQFRNHDHAIQVGET